MDLFLLKTKDCTFWRSWKRG